MLQKAMTSTFVMTTRKRVARQSEAAACHSLSVDRFGCIRDPTSQDCVVLRKLFTQLLLAQAAGITYTGKQVILKIV
jgi:hypothetical protein